MPICVDAPFAIRFNVNPMIRFLQIHEVPTSVICDLKLIFSYGSPNFCTIGETEQALGIYHHREDLIAINVAAHTTPPKRSDLLYVVTRRPQAIIRSIVHELSHVIDRHSTNPEFRQSQPRTNYATHEEYTHAPEELRADARVQQFYPRFAGCLQLAAQPNGRYIKNQRLRTTLLRRLTAHNRQLVTAKSLIATIEPETDPARYWHFYIWTLLAQMIDGSMPYSERDIDLVILALENLQQANFTRRDELLPKWEEQIHDTLEILANRESTYHTQTPSS